MKCPRRPDDPNNVFVLLSKEDEWEKRGSDPHRSCSYCGSMHPEDFLAAVAAGRKVTPTDKSYKAYVDDPWGKFYYQHLDEAQMRHFVDLYNDNKMKLAYPGHFYVLPFFMRLGPASEG